MKQAGTVSVNGLSMYYEIHGAGQPLLLLHGALATIESFGDLLPRLAVSRQVIAVELQAHGRTPDIDRPLTYEALASDIKGLLDHLGYERADLVGYSLGGGVAIEVAMRYPTLVRRVVYAGGPSFSPDGVHPEIAEGFTTEEPEDSAAHQLKGSVWHKAYLDVAPDSAGWPSLVERVSEFDRAYTGWSPRQLRSVTTPVMLIAGDSDIVTPEHMVEMFKLLGGGKPRELDPTPHAQLAIMPGTGHVELLDRVDWLHSLVIGFLDPWPE